LRRAAAASVAVALAALACGVITLQPDPIAPVNQCTDDPSCATTFPEAGAGACVGASCSTTTFAPFLVVAMPQDQVGLGGTTMPVPQNYALVRGQLAQKGMIPTSPQCLNAQQGAPATECDPLPPLASFIEGSLQVATGFDAVLAPPGGLRPNNPSSPGFSVTAVPVNVTVEMLWLDPATNKYAPARKLGIPLDDVGGSLSTTGLLNGPTNGATTVSGFQYAARVPQPLSPADPMNQYRFYVVPSAPYDSIPPLIRAQVPGVAQPGLGAVGQSLAAQSQALKYDTPSADGGASTIQAHGYQINEATGAPSLEGWSAHIDDQNGHRVSGTIVLPAGATKSVTLYEATGTKSQGANTTDVDPDRYVETLYIDPPKGSKLPRFFAEAVAGQITSPVQGFTYPALPTANSSVSPCVVTLEGYVLTSDAQQKSTASLQFVVDNGADTQLLQADLTNAAPLLFSATTTTTQIGQYTVQVYPGIVRVYVVPDDPDLALTVFDKQVSGTSCVQQGVTLPVNHRTHVKGRVVLPNGTPVFAADVVVTASADAPFMSKDDPLARPRESHGTTDTSGAFDVPSDPGFVDISIRPRDTTNFPWVVLTNRVVPPNDGSDAGVQVTLNVADVVIPEPSRFTQAASGVLTDSVGNPIVHAVVRAYAFPPFAAGVDGGAPQTRGARLLGMTVTDDSAQFQLFVVPPQ
jgi:hypothetical protein